MELKSDSLRQEIKYKVFYSDLPKFYQWMTLRSDFKQTYSPRQINSLYLDTPKYDLAFANMTGQSQRIKVRGRWYGTIGSSLKSVDIKNHKFSVKCEIKRKVNSYSDKIIAGSGSFVPFNNSISNSYLNIEKFCIKASENYGLKNAKDLKNSAFINYNREYYESSTISELRLTVDKNVRYSLPTSVGSPMLLAKNYLIVEVKFPPHIRGLVVQHMEKFPFRPVRSSKYIAAMAQIKKVSY
jgi:hypothetical protein